VSILQQHAASGHIYSTADCADSVDCPTAACAAIELNSSKSPAAYAACPWTRTGTAACAAFGRACPTAAYAASGRVCPTAAFAASGLTRTCSKADFAACLCLYSRLRPLDSSVLQQHVLPLDVCLFFDRLCCLWTRLFHNSLCRLGTCVSSMWRPVLLLNVSLLCAFPGHVRVSVLQQSAMSSEVSGLQLHACASNARICSTAANAVPRGLWPTAACAPSVLCVCKSLGCTWTCATPACLSTRALCFTRTCLATRVLCCTWMCLPTRALCCTWTCLSARIFAAPVRVCLQELCDAPGRVCQQECSPGCNCRCSVENLFGLFRFVSKQFCLFRLFRYRFETPKQTEIFYFWFHETNRNKRETDLVSVCFGSNRNLFLFVSKTP